MRKFVVLAVLALAALYVAPASAQSRVFVNDFERPGDDTPAGSWFDAGEGFAPGTIHRTGSGYISPSAYGSGILSAHRQFHARMRDNGCGATRFTTTCFGPFTRWGKPTSVNPTFPSGGYMTEVDIYLDVGWVATGGGKMDYRFDWASAINNSAGSHKRDFVFNVGTPLTAFEATTSPGFYVNASTNATRSGAFPQNPCPNPGQIPPNTSPNYCRAPVKITQSGWYTFRHRFYPRHHMGTDYLAVDFTVLRHDGVVMANWFISITPPFAPDDPMSMVGGDRYGWFVINEINDLAIDCSNLRPPAIGHPPLGAACRFEANGNGNGEACPDDDEDNDGLTDERELSLLTLLGNPDSDLDGTKDGNDDANGNGEDDEDEDDEDDPCPNDSDHDGTDDEDEDD